MILMSTKTITKRTVIPITNPTIAVRAQALAEQIAADFEAYLDAWHGADEVFDNELDAWLHEIYAQVLRGKPVYPPRDIPYFSPSSANSCKRELYEKLRGAKRDKSVGAPHKGRWTRLGTSIGDMIQRDILFAEKHYERLTGAPPLFRFERDDAGRPMFEEFAKKSHVIEHNGHRFALFGTCDGIMRYVTEDGEALRVGLEIKSKQTTYSQTSDYSMRNGPKEDHVKQATCYSLMYDVDYYVILYVNASKKAWEMTEEDYAKNRDIKAFGIWINDIDRQNVLDYFADVLTSVAIGKPPKLDLDKFTFNNYKAACAVSLSDEEFAEIERKVGAVVRSGLPEWKKRGYVDAYEFIKAVRNGGAA
jgi:hypothetical protein